MRLDSKTAESQDSEQPLDEIRTSLLRHSLWLLLALTTLGLIVLPLMVTSVPTHLSILVFSPFFVVMLSSLWLLNRGRREASAWTLVIGIFLLQGFANFFNPGAAEQAMASFLNLILLAGFALHQRAALVTAGLALSAMAAYLLLNEQGLLPAPVFELSLVERLPAIGLTVLTTGGLVTIAVSHAAWAFNREMRARRLAQDSSASLSEALAENALRAKLSHDLVGMGQRLMTSRGTTDQLGTLADTLLEVKGLHKVTLHDEAGSTLAERRREGVLPSSVTQIRLSLQGLHQTYTLVLLGEPEVLHSKAAADFYQTAAGLLSTAEARLEAERQLQKAEQLQAVARLAAGVAHDFNNLLATIQGGVELAQIRLRVGDSPASELTSVQVATERAVRLTRKMASLTKSKEQPRRPTALAPVLRELPNSLQPSLPHTITLRIREPIPAVILTADRVEVEQILLNLINNAAEATVNTGDITVETSLTNRAPPMLRLDVRDEGTGMSPSVCRRVFEPFFTTREGVGGHGLGLTGVRTLVTRLGGRITVESTQGEGSCFSVFLPLEKVQIEPTQRANQTRETPTSSSALAGQRVLVVDDEPDVRGIVVALLDSLGATTSSVGSGSEALEALERDDGFTLLITDVRMPEMDGHALVQAVRRAGHNLPTLLASGFDPGEAPMVPELYSVGRLAKPFRRDRLLACIQQVLRDSQDPIRS